MNERMAVPSGQGSAQQFAEKPQEVAAADGEMKPDFMAWWKTVPVDQRQSLRVNHWDDQFTLPKKAFVAGFEQCAHKAGAGMAETQDCDEDAFVIQKLGELLAGVCLVLKGPELELQRHSYHDIVEVAEKVKMELDLFRAREESTSPAASASSEEAIARKATTPVHTKCATDAKFGALQPNSQRWYKPYRCNRCATLPPTAKEKS